MRTKGFRLFLWILAGMLLCTACRHAPDGYVNEGKAPTIKSVSYPSMQEFFALYNELFERHCKKDQKTLVKVETSYDLLVQQPGLPTKQPDADMAFLSMADEMDPFVEEGMASEDWQEAFDEESSPCSTAVVFLVRKGNEKQIVDWSDLTREDVDVITPDPRSSGAGRWSFLGAWCYADGVSTFTQKDRLAYMKGLYKRVMVMDSNARNSINTFVERGQGDVLITWESEAYLAMEAYPEDYEIVTPNVSILAQPKVALLKAAGSSAEQKKLAKEYLDYMYSEAGQKLFAESYFRPVEQKVMQEYADQFDANMELRTIEDLGGLEELQKEFFEEGGLLDQIIPGE